MTYNQIEVIACAELFAGVSVMVLKGANPIDAFDKDRGKRANGLRLGTGQISVRGMERDHVIHIADIIDKALLNSNNQEALERLKKDVSAVCRQFPVYKQMDKTSVN